MSKKSNTLFNYFAKSPVVDKKAKKDANEDKNEGQENKAINGADDNLKSKGKLFGSPSTPKHVGLNGTPTQTKRKPNALQSSQSDESDDEMPLIVNKKRRIMQLVDSDEEMEVETKTTKNKMKHEKGSILEKLEAFQHDAANNDVDEKMQKKVVKLQDKLENEALNYTEAQEYPHNKYEFLQPDKIKDAKGRRPNHPDYDASTLYVPEKFLNSNLSPAARQWWVLKSQHFDSVLFFKVGKFYELYHMDADVGVKELGFTYMRGEFAHSGFPEVSFDKMASILIDRGYKIARVEQTETPDMMTQRCKTTKSGKYDKVVRREICQISNRGTKIFGSQCQVASSHEFNYMLAIVEQSQEKTSRYGVTFIDTTIGEFHVGEFDDDSGCSRLLTLLSHHMPVLVLSERSALSARTQNIMKSMLSEVIKENVTRQTVANAVADKTLTFLAEKYYGIGENQKPWPATLKALHADDGHLIPTAKSDAKLCLQALGLCIEYIKHHMLEPHILPTARYTPYVPLDECASASKEKESQQKVAVKKAAEFMVLDSTTLHNLHIIGKGDKHTLEYTLDSCCTKFGKRLLHHWICAPSCNLELIKSRQKAISVLMNDTEKLKSLRNLFSTLPDLERILTQLQLFGNHHIKSQEHPDSRAVLFEQSIYNKKKMKSFLNTLKSFDDLAKKLPFLYYKEELVEAPLLQCLLCLPKDGGKFPDMTEHLEYFQVAFDHEKAAKDGVMAPNPGADIEYDDCQKEIADINKTLDDYLRELERHFNCRLQYFGSDKKRFQIEVPEKQAAKAGREYSLESQRKGFKRYSTEKSRELLKAMINAEEKRANVLTDIARRMFAKFSEQYAIWKQAVECISNLDVLCALANYALDQNVITIPELEPIDANSKPYLYIENGYHPLINNADCIPNGIEMGTKNAAPLTILTGANMGGKSTLMRQVGLLVIMAQIGAHVPAEVFRGTIVDRIFTRAGAQDDIIAGMSTFMVELNETSFIFKHATVNSLVLLDELGRGTGSYDGFAVAASVVNFLADLKCRTLFSTHYHNLLNFFYKDPRITVGHMACLVENEDNENPTQEDITFLYKYSTGPCPKSYGFHTAKLAATPATIIQRAYNVAREIKSNTIKRKVSYYVASYALKGQVDMSALQQLFAQIKTY